MLTLLKENVQTPTGLIVKYEGDQIQTTRPCDTALMN